MGDVGLVKLFEFMAGRRRKINVSVWNSMAQDHYLSRYSWGKIVSVSFLWFQVQLIQW